MFTVEKINKGYRLVWTGLEPLSWLIDGRHACWFKYKRDAIRRAEELNKGI